VEGLALTVQLIKAELAKSSVRLLTIFHCYVLQLLDPAYGTVFHRT